MRFFDSAGASLRMTLNECTNSSLFILFVMHRINYGEMPQNIVMTYFLWVLAGLASGIFGGLGMGGGTLLIPILTIFLGFDQKLSQGINLLSFLVMAIFSIFIHAKNGYIVTKHIFWIVLFGIIFSGVGAVLMTYLPSKILKMAFGAFLCVLAVLELWKALKK